MRSVRSSPNNGFLEQCPHPPRRFVVPKIAQQESLERNTSRAFRLEVSETYSTGRLLGNAEAQCRQGIMPCPSSIRRQQFRGRDEGNQQLPTRRPVGQQKIDRHKQVSRATAVGAEDRSEEHTSELQSLMRNSYAVFCLKKK